MAASVSNAQTQSGRAIWIGWCITSPVITASSPREEMRTLAWPGVWPGVGSSQTSDVSLWVGSTSSASPASTTGRTESSICSAISLGPSKCDQ